MKKISHVIFIMLAFALSSCKKDFLDLQPLDEYSETSLWTSVEDAEAALNGCYNGWESGEWIYYIDCASDNAFNPYPWEGYSMMGNMVLLTPTNTGINRWNFNTIQKVNWFLANIDKVTMDDELKDRMKAEARFLRAYKYVIMTQAYGDVPLLTANITPEEANGIGRTPKAEVVKFILDELADLPQSLPESYSGEDVGRITSGAAWALKARTELYNGMFAECIASCNQVIGKYELFSSFPDLFRIQHENNSEIILDVQFVQNFNSLGVGVLPPQTSGGWWSVNPTQSLVDEFEMINGKTIDDPTSGYNPDDPYQNRDPRLQYTIVVPGALYDGAYFDPLNPSSYDYYAAYNYTGYAGKKFTSNLSDFTDMWNTGLNIPVIRYAEVLLMYAEAKVENGEIDNSVYDALDQVRERAGMPVVDRVAYASQPDLRELVRRERRVELALEGLRWFDVQRWKIAEEVMDGPVYGSRLGTVDPDTGELDLNDDRILSEQRSFDESKNYLWPIPQSQIDINKNLTQNSGY